jgi:hypothetical protein
VTGPYAVEMTVAVFVGAGLLMGLLVVWAGHRMLRNGGAPSSGAADALGNFIDVFDPARARADRDLESHKNMGEVLPSPDDDDDPGHPHWNLDLLRGEVRVRLPRPPVSPP